MSLKVRIYLDKKLNLDLDLILEKEDAHYLANVMRLISASTWAVKQVKL